MTDQAVLAVIALGANLGNMEKTLQLAVVQLSELANTELIKSSSVYHSRPLGPPDQPDYVNQVALVKTSLSPHRLLDELQAIEQRHGRVKGQHWGARTLDLDIIVYGDITLKDDRLTIPHPQAYKRSFVLEPLAEVAPQLVIPGYGTVAELCSAADDGLVYRRSAR